MSREWDTSLKLLIGEKPQDFISWLVPGANFRRVVSPHLPGRKIDADCLFEIILNGERLLFHIEFQSYRDRNMVERLWDYNVGETPRNNFRAWRFVFILKRRERLASLPITWD